MPQLGTAIFDPTEKYRYLLTRSWPSLEMNGTVTWVMLNPSTADAYQDDPTIRRCISFSQNWGYSGLIIVNVYALRSTDPKGLLTIQDPIGRENPMHIQNAIQSSQLTIAAWGAFKVSNQTCKLGLPNEVYNVLRQAELHCLGTTKEGYPRHPLYIKGSTKPQRLSL